jgi:hypothetical protein
MTGTRWVLFVIPAKAGIQSPRLSEFWEPLNLGSRNNADFNALFRSSFDVK